MLAYFDALEHADGERACAQLTHAVQERARTEAGAATCPEALEAVARYVPDAAKIFAGMSVKSVTVDGDRAVVTLDSEIKDFASTSRAAREGSLERVDGGWKIAKLPTGPSRPNPFAECVGSGMRGFDDGSADPYWKEQGRDVYFTFVKRVCRRVVKEYPDGKVPDGVAERIGGAVLRDMIERDELPPP